MVKNKSRTLALTLACLSIVIFLALAATTIIPSIKTPQQVAAEASPPVALPITAEVERRAVAGSITMRSIVVPGATNDIKVTRALAEVQPVITGLPSADRQQVRTGDVVVEANGEPVIAMQWDFSPYRDLYSGDTGPDVLQLQKNLMYLGYLTSNSGIFDSATQQAFSQLYLDLGYTAPVAEAIVTTETGGVVDLGGSSPEFSPSDKTSTSSAPDVSQNSTKQLFMPARSILPIPQNTSDITELPLDIGQIIDSTDKILIRLDGEAPKVVAATTVERSTRITLGDKAILTSSKTGAKFSLSVESISSSVEDVPGLGTGVRVELKLDEGVAALPPSSDNGTEMLEIVSGSANQKTLALPITAIHTEPNGKSYVVPAEGDGKKLEVKLGASVEGWVEIEGASQLEEGDSVEVGLQGSGQ